MGPDLLPKHAEVERSTSTWASRAFRRAKTGNPLTPMTPTSCREPQMKLRLTGRRVKKAWAISEMTRFALTSRCNYGFLLDLGSGFLVDVNITEPCSAKQHVQVAFPVHLAPIERTDLCFRGYDNAFPDFF